MNLPILTFITLLPLVAGIIVAGLGEQKQLARKIALITSFLSLGLVLVLWKNFDSTSGAMRFVEGPRSWIPTLGVNYFVGMDGLGLLMLLLTAIITPMAMLASWRVEKSPSLFFALVLFLQGARQRPQLHRHADGFLLRRVVLVRQHHAQLRAQLVAQFGVTLGLGRLALQ